VFFCCDNVFCNLFSHDAGGLVRNATFKMVRMEAVCKSAYENEKRRNGGG
jgi:hypothetical protein